MLIGYMAAFVFYSFIGWFVDAFYRSFWGESWTENGYFKLPFRPVYGFGVVLTIALFTLLENQEFWIRGMIYFVMLSVLEYITALFIEKTLNKKLWDYSDEKETFWIATKVHMHGRISLLHSFYWVVLSFFFEIVLYRRTYDIMIFLDNVPKNVEVIFFIIFIGLCLLITSFRISNRQKEIIEEIVEKNKRRLDFAGRTIRRGTDIAFSIPGRISRAGKRINQKIRGTKK